MSKMKVKQSKSNFYNNRYYDETVDVYCGDNHWNIQNQQQQQTRSKLAEHIQTNVQKKKDDIDVKVPLKEWMTLLEESNIKNSIQFSIERATYKAVAEFYNVEFSCIFDIIVYSNKQRIPLLPSTLAVRGSSIKFTENLNGEAQNEDNDSCIGLHLDAHSFYPERIGKYQVTLDILANYLTTKKNGVGLSIPNATYNSMDIKIFKKVSISITEPSNIRSNAEDTKFSIQDNQHISNRFVKFPPTSYIRIQWTDFEDDDNIDSPIILENPNNNNNNEDGALSISISKPTPTNPAIELPKANVQQFSLVTVEEGVVVLVNSFKYNVVSGSLSSIEVVCDASVKILSVEGSNIKKWDINQINSGPLLNIDNDSTHSKKDKQVIKVQLSSSIESSYILRVISEIEMYAASGNVTIPSFRCRGSEISREKGYMVVESAANVQVEQISKEGLTVIDKTELPDTLVGFSSGPLLLSYKFLDPRYRLDLKIIKHQDLSVLVAICDSANYMATLSNEGSLLYKLIFRIKNTQQQYIRIKIPHQFNIWSTIVAQSAVKPGLDGENTIMIPLKKSPPGKGVQKSFNVEIVYKHANGIELLNQGKLNLIFPQIDIPISTLYMNLYLPADYKYGKFDGNVNQVRYFNGSPPNGYSGVSSSSSRGGAGGARDLQVLNAMPQSQVWRQQDNMNINSNAIYHEDLLENDSDDEEDEDTQSNLAEKDSTVGLKPIMVNIPQFGTNIKLQQLLLLSTPINISTTYKSKKSCC